MRMVRGISAFTLLSLLLAVGGCDDSSVDPDAGPSTDASTSGDAGSGDDAATARDAGGSTATVGVAFEHLVDGSPVVFGSEERPYTNAAGNEFGVTRLVYFISNVTLTYVDGAEVTVTGAHYVDHEMEATRVYELPAEVPVGDLDRISFVMGLPPELNVTGAFTSPPESLMEWPEMMGGGYHYMKFEGRYLNSMGEPFNFRTHSGGLDGVDYSFVVTLDATGRAVADGATFTLEMNLEQWFTDPNTWDLNDYFNADHPGIMGNADAQASLQANGATVFTLGDE